MTFKKLQRFTRGDSPLHRLVTLHDELNHLFGHALTRPFETPFDPDNRLSDGGFLPALDLYDDKDALVVKVELPGLKKEDIAISLEEGVLTVSGERKQETKHDSATACRCERAQGQFERRISLPAKVDAAKIQAAYTAGVLTITLPKAEEAKVQIPINIQ